MITNIKLADLYNVKELGEGKTVELWHYKGRIVIRAYNCSGNEHTDVDLGDLINCIGQHIMNSISSIASIPENKDDRA